MKMSVFEDPSILNARRTYDRLLAGQWLVQILSAVADAKIADALDEQPANVAVLAEKTGLHEESLFRALRALACNGIFEREGDRSFRHNAMSLLLRSDHPCSLRLIVSYMNIPMQRDGWTGFPGSLKDGKSGLEHASGSTLFEILKREPKEAAIFNNAMACYSRLPVTTITSRHPAFAGARSLLDVGGGAGGLVLAAAMAHPELRGTVLDLAHVEQTAKALWERAGLSERLTFQRGDFFESVPGGHDVYTLRNILWDWSDELCLKLLKNIRSAIGEPKGARLVVIEHILVPETEAFATLFDVLMLTMTANGRSRTREELSALMDKSGFRLEEITNIEGTTVAHCVPV